MALASSRFDRPVVRRPEQQSHELDVAIVYDVAEDCAVEKVRVVAQDAVKRITGTEKHRIPLLPNVAAKAMEIAGNPDVSVRELEALIQPDPMLTARVLSIANSPLYSRGGVIRSLRNAVMQLGVGMMRDVLYQSVAEAHIFRGKAEVRLRGERVHAVAVGYLARMVFKSLGIGTEYAFLCGLLHDVGRTLLWQQFDDAPPEGLDANDLGAVIELIHTQVGAAVLERWRLPGLAGEAVRRHHKYQDFAKDGGYSQVGHAVAAAERLAEHIGFGDTNSTSPISDDGDMILGGLGFHGDSLTQLLEQAAEIARQLGR